jgi:predicted DNA-binding protein
MSRRRVDPTEQDAPRITTLVRSETRERVIELAEQSGTSYSATARELIERGIRARDEDEQ